MERKSIVIDIPDGMCIDESNSTFEKIVFKKKYAYPKSWEEFVTKNPVMNDEYYIDRDSIVKAFGYTNDRPDADKNLCKTKEEAEAFLALIQLKRLWHEYVDNYSGKVDDDYCYNIDMFSSMNSYEFKVFLGCSVRRKYLFKFPSEELAEEFLNNFRDLFIKASPLWI